MSPIDDFNHYVQLDGTDTVVGRVTRVSYGLTNNFFRKPGGTGARSSQMVSVSLGQSYYTDQRAAQYDLSYQTAYGSAPSHFSPLALAGASAGSSRACRGSTTRRASTTT